MNNDIDPTQAFPGIINDPDDSIGIDSDILEAYHGKGNHFIDFINNFRLSSKQVTDSWHEKYSRAGTAKEKAYGSV